MKPCSSVDCCFGMNPFSIVVDPTKSGRVVAILGFCDVFVL